MTLLEILVALVIVAALFLIAGPAFASARERNALRAAREQMTASFAAARAAAIQKGRTSTMTVGGDQVLVQVRSGLNNVLVTVFGPIGFQRDLGVRIQPIGGAPTALQYDARGLLTPLATGTLRYALVRGAAADTVCISQAGMILKRGCQL